MMRGNVFDIQRYSIHDGEGIRTVVFLKGCPLRCRWCANPESWEPDPCLFYVRSRCIGCGTCTAVCPDHEAEKDGDHIRLHRERGTKDYAWTQACPTGALCVKGERTDVREVMEEIRKDRVFYEHSHGGVTFSGGEPLMQKEFLLELLKTCRAEGIHTAVETTGFVNTEVLREVMPYVELFLYDVKAMDPEVHRKWTGQSNEIILENLRFLAEAGAGIMVRTPMIPGVNDREEDIRQIMEYLKACGIRNYAVLPFHQYGSGKYESAGIPYELAGLPVHEESYVQKIQGMIAAEGFQAI